MPGEICQGYASVPAGAEYLDISPRKMWELVKEGKVPSYRIGKRLVRVRFTDLDRLMTEGGLATGAQNG